MKHATVGRPKLGDNVKEVSSIRLEPSVKEKILHHFGSLQVWIDLKIKETFADKK